MAHIRDAFLANQARLAAFFCVIIVLGLAIVGLMYLIAHGLPAIP